MGFISAKTIFDIMDQKTEIELQEIYRKEKNLKLIKDKEILGKIEFRKVKFCYPTRKRFALDDVSFTVMPGKKFALVGHSGCGSIIIIIIITLLIIQLKFVKKENRPV